MRFFKKIIYISALTVAFYCITGAVYAEEKSEGWDKVGKEVSEAASAVSDATKKTYQKTSKGAQEVWDKTKKSSSKAWQDTKETSKDIAEVYTDLEPIVHFHIFPGLVK